MLKRLLTVISLLLLTTVVTACNTNTKSSGNHEKIQVVATVDFYGEVAKAVGGKQVQVTSIIDNPAIDPHDYEPTTQVGKQVATADLIIANGIGYDGWMDKLIKSENKSKQYLRVADDLMAKHEGDNEHIWYDPRTMPKLANALASKFAKEKPAKKAIFKANAKKYIASLNSLNALITKLKQNAHGQKVDVSEPVFGYALNYLATKSTTVILPRQLKKVLITAPKISMRLKPTSKKRKSPSSSTIAKPVQKPSIVSLS